MKPIVDPTTQITVKDKDNKDVAFDTKLEVQVDESKYQAIWKDFRKVEGLLNQTPTGAPIKWFNGFGAKYKDGTSLETGKQVDFTITVRRPPDARVNGEVVHRKLCYFDIVAKKVVDIEEATGSSPDYVVFTLKIGDPPTGMYP